MPNHIRNAWKISKIPEDKVNYILDKITQVYKPVAGEIRGIDESARIVDFDLIVPEPRMIQDCPKQYIQSEHKPPRIQTDDSRPWFNWYDWHCDNWGTKWNAYDGYVTIGKTWIRLVFNTAWSFPEPIAHALFTMLESSGLNNLEYDLCWADEDLGSNCGRMTHCSLTGITSRILDQSDKVKYARYIWNRY